MAHWYTHYQIANKLADRFTALRRDYFLLGNLAPDSGIKKAVACYDPPSIKTHFTKSRLKSHIQYERILNDYLLKCRNIKEISFIYGYYCHLLSDYLYAVNYLYPLFAKYGISLKDKKAIDLFREERQFTQNRAVISDPAAIAVIKSLPDDIDLLNNLKSDDFKSMLKRIIQEAEYQPSLGNYLADCDENIFIGENYSLIENNLSEWLKEPVNYSTLLLDVDETILNFRKAEKEGLREVFEKNGVKISSRLLNTYKATNHELWQRIEKGTFAKADLEKTRFSETFRRLGLPSDIGPKCGHDFTITLSQKGYYLPYAKKMVTEMAKEYDLAIVTNGFKVIQEGRLKDCGLDRIISKVFISEEIGYEKPDRRLFEFVINRLKTNDLHQILMIGDSLTSDIKGAQNSGITPFWISKHAEQGQKDLAMGSNLKTLYTWLHRPNIKTIKAASD